MAVSFGSAGRINEGLAGIRRHESVGALCVRSNLRASFPGPLEAVGIRAGLDDARPAGRSSDRVYGGRFRVVEDYLAWSAAAEQIAL